MTTSMTTKNISQLIANTHLFLAYNYYTDSSFLK